MIFLKLLLKIIKSRVVILFNRDTNHLWNASYAQRRLGTNMSIHNTANIEDRKAIMQFIEGISVT